MRTVALPVVFCLSLSASFAFAQSPFPGGVNVNGGWVPCNHPIAIAAGQGCVSNPTPPPPPPPPRDCLTVDPYAEPLLAWVCAIEGTYKRNDLPTSFTRANGDAVLPVVGREYTSHYPSPAFGRLTVLSLGLTTTNPQHLVVTYQFTAGERNGEIGSFINGGPGTPIGPWKELPQP